VKRPHTLVAAVAMLLAGSLCLQPSLAQTAAAPAHQPEIGQRGKDVIWLPTALELVDRMLDMAKVTKDDYVIDLGSGDGRVVITAAQRGVKSHGIEYDANLVQLSKENAVKAGVADKATFAKADIFESDFSRATVLTLFLLPELNLRLRPILLGLKPGTRVVSNTFTMGDWEADESVAVDAVQSCQYWCTAYLWIVPAKVEGTWQFGTVRLTLRQSYQFVTGALESNGKSEIISSGRMKGDEFSFRAGGANYRGRLNGTRIEGFVTTGDASRRWVATRSKP
jgi:SAM-dependent methyltransferase